MSDLPANIQPRQRRTRLMLQIENQRIIDLMRSGASDFFIQQQLQIKPKNYVKRLQKLRDQDLKDTLDKQTAEAKAQLLQNCIRKIQALEINANNILLSSDSKPLEKIAAMNCLRQYAIDIGRLNTEGPFVFSILDNGLYRRNDTAIPSAPVLPTSEPQIEDKNRVA